MPTVRSLPFALCLVMASVAPTRAADDLIEYYSVYGTTPNEMRESINSQGPVGTDGRRHDAYTKWNISWKSSTERNTIGACRIKSFDVTLAITFMLPKWRDEGRAETSTIRAWTTYLTSLKRHENGHKKLAADGADSIRAVVARIPDSGDCAEVGRTASDSAKAITARVKVAQAKYDADTDHGRGQGARFP